MNIATTLFLLCWCSASNNKIVVFSTPFFNKNLQQNNFKLKNKNQKYCKNFFLLYKHFSCRLNTWASSVVFVKKKE